MLNSSTGLVTAFFIAVILTVPFVLKQRGENPNTIANVVTSIGILGTFVGIYLGLMDFNESDISGSIPQLLSGLKTAFVSSIAGLLVSIFIKGFGSGKRTQSPEERQLSSTFNDIAYSLREIKLGISGPNEDSLLAQTKRSRQDNARQLQQLNLTLRDFSERMVADSTQSLIDALTQVMRDFNTRINEQLGENFKHLNESIGRMTKWQQTYYQQVEQMVEQFNLALAGLEQSRKILQGITGSTEVYHQSAEKLDHLLHHLTVSLKGIEELAKGAKETFPSIEQKIHTLTTSFSEAVEVAVRENNRMIESQQNAINHQISTLAKSYEDTKGQQRRMVEDLNTHYIKNMSERYEATGEQLKNFDKELEKELTKALESMGSQLTSLSSRFVEDYDPLTKRLRDIVQIASRVSNGVS